MWFKSKTLEEQYPPKDSYQEEYRKKFGGIIDKYLIHHSEDDDEEILVYIDTENDVDWIIQKDPLKDENLRNEREKYIAKLNVAEAYPSLNLSQRNVLKFKIMLGAGYVAAIYGNYESVQPAIDAALKFLKDRNREQSRFLILSFSSFLILVTILLGVCFSIFGNENFIGLLMGVLGAYVSIWSRFGKMNMTGLASKNIHFLEAFARLFCGGIFAFVAMQLLNTGLVLKDFTINNVWSYNCIIGFVAGFNERFVPTIIETISSNSKNNKEDDDE